MATRFGIDHAGQRIEVAHESLWSGTIVRLFVDGEQVAETKCKSQRITVSHDDLAVTTWLPWHATWIQRAELVVGGEEGGGAAEGGAPTPASGAAQVGAPSERDEATRSAAAASGPLALEPEPGSRAARREQFAREHPGLYAARHAAKGVGQVLLGLVGVGLLIRLLPAVPLDVSLPSIDLPLPSISLPELPTILPTPPAWLRAIGESAKYWGPILAGIVFALREYDRRTRAQPDNAQERSLHER